MADGEIRINTKIDESGLNKGLQSIKKQLNDVGNANSTKGLANLGLALGGVTAAAGVAAKGIQKVQQAINECTEAYKVQKSAEVALSTAAQNNPYLNRESVQNLKEFASEMQGITAVGDEELLPLMSRLAAAGRTQSEIQAIVKASLDVSASGAMGLSEAVENLNRTFSGTAGRLSATIPAIKDLTEEELKNGKAIEVIQKQYNGMAKSIADSTGAQQKLKNSLGDLKEEIGASFTTAAAPVQTFFSGVIDGFTNSLRAGREFKEFMKEFENAQKAENPTDNQNEVLLQGYKDQLTQLEINYNAQKQIIEKYYGTVEEFEKFQEENKEWIEGGFVIGDFNMALDAYNKMGDYKKQIASQNEKIQKQEKVVADNAERAAKAEKEKADAKTKEERNKTAAEYIKANTDALQKQIETLELTANVTGENVDIQDMYNAYLKSYIDLITNSNGLVTENNTAAKERLKIIQELANALNEETDAQKKADKAKDLYSKISGLSGNGSIIDQYKNRNAEIAELERQLNEGLIEDEEVAAKARLEIDKAYAQNKKDLAKDIAEEVIEYTQQTMDVINQATELMLQNVQNEKDVELDTLEDKYEKGEVSEEEYYEKRKQIQKKAAQDEYKIKMFEWTASMLAATANIAQGVTKAIAQGGVAGIITGALVAAAGGVQIASIMASKPTPPSFATGGIVGGANGATMGGDNTYAHVRTGEMIINANQQRALWDMLNGQPGRGGGMSLTVNNTMADRAETNVREQNGDLFIDILDKHINQEFAEGGYNVGVAAMQSKQTGVSIL